MHGWIDLHCHWIPGIDDGVRDLAESAQLLGALGRLGFERVIATPHMRPGLFDTNREHILTSFEHACRALKANPGAVPLPALSVGAEHYFDDVVYARLRAGQGVPYPGDRAVLLEFYEIDFPTHVDRLLAQLKRDGLTPVIAHPERYRSLWKRPTRLEQLLDTGAVALLDTAALVGKYGRTPRRCALDFLERGLYRAACSDAHRPSDVAQVARGIEEIDRRFGSERVGRLFGLGPGEILAGGALSSTGELKPG
jgi:protein-tyrosine phosphatase